MTLALIKKRLRQHRDPKRAINTRNFFKHIKNDQFLGVSAHLIRKIAKEFPTTSLADIRLLTQSNVHDERRIAHQLLCLQFDKANEAEQTRIYNFYLKNRQTIRDWDGVDDSAPYIVGRHLLERDKSILYQLAKSKHLWDRRIAMVATWWFIRQNKLTDTLKLAEQLLHDEEDLIHKATGWMLREVGKRNVATLKRFLKKHHRVMPRTMLRYAIERFNENERQSYLKRH